jgi:hypothetical protein
VKDLESIAGIVMGKYRLVSSGHQSRFGLLDLIHSLIRLCFWVTLGQIEKRYDLGIPGNVDCKCSFISLSHARKALVRKPYI